MSHLVYDVVDQRECEEHKGENEAYIGQKKEDVKQGSVLLDLKVESCWEDEEEDDAEDEKNLIIADRVMKIGLELDYLLLILVVIQGVTIRVVCLNILH